VWPHTVIRGRRVFDGSSIKTDFDEKEWWLHLILVRRFEYTSDPESYTSSSVATDRAPPCWTVQRVGVRRRETPKLMLEAASSVAA